MFFKFDFGVVLSDCIEHLAADAILRLYTIGEDKSPPEDKLLLYAINSVYSPHHAEGCSTPTNVINKDGDYSQAIPDTNTPNKKG